MTRLILILAIPAAILAQTGALMPVPRQSPLDNNGHTLAGSCVYSYAAGTTTPQTTYSNSTLATPNANPMVVDGSGRIPPVYLSAASYKFVFANKVANACPGSPGTVIWSQDNVYDFGALLKAALVASSGSGLVGFIQAGTGAIARTAQSKLRESVTPEDFGAAGNGSTNDSSACQNASNYLTNTFSGGIINFGAKTYICNFTIGSNITVQGAGVGATTIKSAPGSNLDVIKGTHFATLTNTPIVVPETRGDNLTGIFDLTIDGNKSANAAGFGIRIWGMSMTWTNVTVQNCAQLGIWTEYSDGSGANLFPANPKLGDPKAIFSGIRLIENGGGGFMYQGPNDGTIRGLLCSLNTGNCLETNSKTVAGVIYHVGTLDLLSDANAYGDSGTCFYFGPNATVLAADSVVAGSCTNGIYMDAMDGSSKWTNVTVAGQTNGYGVWFQGAHNYFQGEVSRNGTGFIMQNLLDSNINISGDGNGIAVLDVTESNGNLVLARFNTPAVLDDLTSGGVYAPAALNYYNVQITSTGTPDKFQWQKNGGAWNTNVSITGVAQALADGVTITFAATTGHFWGSFWNIQATNIGPVISAPVLRQAYYAPYGNEVRGSTYIGGQFHPNTTAMILAYGNQNFSQWQQPGVYSRFTGQNNFTVCNQAVTTDCVSIYHTGATGDAHIQSIGVGDIYLDSPAHAASVITTPTTVGALGACGAAQAGSRRFVSNSNAASYTAGIGTIVAAGGATPVPVVCDGGNWRIG